jgi:serine/threonine-protein kinase SRPK3
MGPDINPSNIMLTINDESLLEEVEKNESMNLLPKKVIDSDRTIYSSHQLGCPKDSFWCLSILCDFGEARIGARHNGIIQPRLYRAPEVVFEMKWDSKVDIWSLVPMVSASLSVGCALLTKCAQKIWDLYGNGHLFKARNKDGKFSASHHVAEMVGLLGMPPAEFLERSDHTRKFFDEQGQPQFSETRSKLD